jgi:diacylglycerol kinase (ATP)
MPAIRLFEEDARGYDSRNSAVLEVSGRGRSDKTLRVDDPATRFDSVTLCSHMRAAAILGLGCSPKNLMPFQANITTDSTTNKAIDWRIGVPADADQVDIILLFGGDGTVHRHLSQLVKLGVPVLIVPTGSGNDLARALGLRRVRDSFAAWRRFLVGQNNVRTIDLGVITPLEAAGGEPPRDGSGNPVLGAQQHYFCSVAGIGLDGEVARRANALPRWLRGHGGYALSLVSTMFRFGPRPIKILTPTEAGGWTTRSDQPTILVALANTSTYGGGMNIAPRAQMDDGQLDVCMVGGVDPFKLACMFPTVYFGRHLSIREVAYFKTPSLRLETGTPLDVYADGEYVCRTPIEVTVQSGALKVLTS